MQEYISRVLHVNQTKLMSCQKNGSAGGLRIQQQLRSSCNCDATLNRSVSDIAVILGNSNTISPSETQCV